MIAALNNSPTLDDVLDRLASLQAPPNASQLREFLSAYPQFADEIVDFATDWVAMESLPDPEPVSKEEASLIVDRTMSRVRQMMFENSRSQQLVDLSADIKASGHDPVSFVQAVGIDASILDCLANRWVHRKTLPKRLIVEMSAALGRTAETVRDFFRLPPVAAYAYRSRTKPEVVQAGFTNVIKQSTLSDADKLRWLAEEPDDQME
jgi:hypothetical protein